MKRLVLMIALAAATGCNREAQPARDSAPTVSAVQNER